MSQRRISKLAPAWTVMGVAMLLAGCGSDPRPATIPTPSFSCTPDPAGAPCTAELAAAQAEETKAYAEAEFAYREFTKERNRIAMAGGSPTPTPQMQQYAAGDYLDTVGGFLASGYSAGRRTSAPLEISRLQVLSVEADRITFLACEDGSRAEVLSKDNTVVTRGQLGAVVVTAQRFPDGWKMVDGENTEASRCA